MPSPATSPWEFWIDVGGTFTDCLARNPEGQLFRNKRLSSGVTKGAPSPHSTRRCVVDPLRIGDPADFWAGHQLTLFDNAANPLGTARVLSSSTSDGRLTLATPLEFAPSTAATYQLKCGLDAPVLAIRHVLGLRLDQQVPGLALRLGTTRGTNALLTRTGARTALATTAGFGDLLAIGYQDRPRLFELAVLKPAPLAEQTIEIRHRVSAAGDVLLPPRPDEIRSQLTDLRASGVESLAICLLHADRFPDHEILVEEIARDVGFAEVSRSSHVAPLVKVVARAETTTADAYLNPILRDYLDRLGRALPGSTIRLMTSAGGLASPEAFRGFQSVLSGPAGGVVGYAAASQAAGFSRAVGFDMGGTSTDVSRYDGRLDVEYESRKAGIRLMTPTLAIDTVAAGGGSICSFDGAKLVVGPASAGAYPGPACYGQGGPLTITDLNVYLGRLLAEEFPFPLQVEAIEARLNTLCQEVADATGTLPSPHALAEGLLEVANANMARAIRNVTVMKGYDPQDYLMVAFGGAAGLHACAVAQQLGITRILDPRDAGILSAYGIGQADVVRHAAVGLSRQADDLGDAELIDRFADLAAEPIDALRGEVPPSTPLQIVRTLDVRCVGTDSVLHVCVEPQAASAGMSEDEPNQRPDPPAPSTHPPDMPSMLGDWRRRFAQQHLRQFGYLPTDRALEVVAARVEVTASTATPPASGHRADQQQSVLSRRNTPLWWCGQPIDAALFNRSRLKPGDQLRGPALVTGTHSTLMVAPDWVGEVLANGDLLLGISPGDPQSAPEPSASAALATAPDSAVVEVFHNLLAGIAERMGHVLQRTASSVNVKERLDYSCAVFTGNGALVANAPHVPVHLGAMGASVRAILAANPDIRPGDVYVTNDPYAGGSHLPDVTVVLPVFAPASDLAAGEMPAAREHDPAAPLFFTGVRAHHAEIGGVRPGSMPPGSRRLGEEGVVLSGCLLAREGTSHEDAVRKLLTEAPYPSRAVDDNLADLRAQVAAARQGAADLLELVQQHGAAQLERQMRAVQHATETLVRRAIARLPQGVHERVDYLQTHDGRSIPIAVRIEVQAATSADALPSPAPAAIKIDFTGTAPVDAGNLNANPAIVAAAVLYVLRLLMDEDVPLNEGALRAVELVIPVGLLNPPPAADRAASPAVAAGNVETSQRIVDVLLGALGIAAASQGTMNNLIYGNQQFGCYETIGGGSGATANAPGADAVQVHMTNTRATDPEVLERRLPVRLWEFSIRRGSGGLGRQPGGNGLIRRLEFLEPLSVSLITQRRGASAPFGLAGGESGQPGLNLLIARDGSRQELPAMVEFSVHPGDQLQIETPGGGGYGSITEVFTPPAVSR
jgi:5-oxoprolinase (ATP-hydrolysing)